tara:strand:- start:8984 stop:10012 length:1029 start_codon:yes stop_codon:yes gene_type:complete
VKKLRNFSKFEIIFRCDAGDLPELGYGHLYRSILLANFLKKKFFLPPEKILFIIKTNNKYSKSLNILKEYKFKIISLRPHIKDYSSDEIFFLQKFKANLIIIDRLGKLTKNFNYKLQANFKKKIIIDDSSSERKFFDLSLNPLIQNVPKYQGANIGYKYLILNQIKKSKTKDQNNIFIFFGGYDKKKMSKRILKALNKIKLRFNIFVPESYKKLLIRIKSRHKIFFYKGKQYPVKLAGSKLAITAGGIGLFDAILNKKKIICIPQYEHQKINATKIFKKKAIKLLNFDDKKFNLKFTKFFLEIYDNNSYQKKINAIHDKIVNLKMLNKTLNLISKVYEKSKN